MTSIVTVIKYFEDVEFMIERRGNTANKVILLTKEGWYSLNNKGARFMKLLK